MIHPQSYVHSIVRFKNGLTKMILYNADMKIPIFNTLQINKGGISRKKINVDILNKMNFENVNIKKLPAVKLIDKCIKAGNSGPTILNASNEVLVNLFLNKKITFLDIVKNINKVFNDKDFRKYARKKAKTLKELEIIDNWARLKTLAISVR